MANPYAVTPMLGEGIARGLGYISQGLERKRAEEAAAKAEQDQLMAQQRQSAAQRMAIQAMQSGDTAALEELAIKDPALYDRVGQVMNFRDQRTRDNYKESLRRIVSGENPEQVLMERAEFVQSQGGDPSQTLREIETFRADPDRFQKSARSLYAMEDPKASKELRELTGGLDPLKREELDIKREANKIRELERRERSLDRQLSRETNELKRRELEGKLASAKAEKEQKKRDMVADNAASVASFDNTLATIDKIEQSPGFSAAVGARIPFIDQLPGGDAQETIGLVETLKSQSFLNEIQKMKGMGALSNAEGEKLSSAIGSLNRDMSEKAFKKSLDSIRQYITKAKNNMMSRLPEEERSASEQAGDQQSFGEGTIIDNPATGESLILQGGEWVPYG